ncbi:cytochrome P450 [Sporormia fimetaria CBS 119925]|uniref:Cytochrome P450 n=1 Tax=Sporormia fimetaria CBS 119925 TaxID=1340428 RepID=A0A6A6VP16_9PLEO|nr:cytochrome P450 [Sporormia fimetaria CBS 119925]
MLSASSFIWVSLVLLVFKVSYSRLQARAALSRATAQHGCAAPPTVPSKDPVFGLDTVFETFKRMKDKCRMRETFEDAQRYGHTFQSFPFGRRTITTTSAKNIQTVLSLQHEKFGVGPIRSPATHMLGKGIIMNDGKVWEHGRSMIRPAFTRTNIADREMFEVHVERLFDLLPEDGEVVDLQPLFDKLILDSSSEFIFGRSFASLLPTTPLDSEAFLSAFNAAQGGVGIRVLLGKMRFILFRDKKFNEACSLIQDYTQKHIDRVLKEPEKPSDSKRERVILLNELAKETSDRNELCSQLLNVFFAGRDTPAVALTNIFFLLSRHPDVWKKCRDEVQGLQKKDLSFEKLKSLRYIQHVINEAFRLLPPVATQSRTCLTPTTLPTGGVSPDSTSNDLPIAVLPGDTLLLNFYTLHRSPTVFGPDPESFRPERWVDARPGWEFLPFGGGARHCPAQQLALFWVGYTLVRMLLAFEEVRNMDEVEGFVERMKLNMESERGARVSFVRA